MWFTEKLGPVPRYVWIGGGVLAAYAFMRFRGRTGQPTVDTAAADTVASNTATGLQPIATDYAGAGYLPNNKMAEDTYSSVVTGGGGQGQSSKQTPTKPKVTAPKAAGTRAPARSRASRSSNTGTPAASRRTSTPDSTPMAVHATPVATMPSESLTYKNGVIQPVIHHVGETVVTETRRGSRNTRVNRGD
jgi:hypothetical protein